MVIERIETTNFRSLKSVDIQCSNLLAILGRNGAGKSNILHALDVFYDVAAQLTECDYFDKDTSSEISIRLTYGDLRQDELREFESHVQDGKLIVTKVVTSGGAKYYAASRQLPDFVEIRKLGAGPKRTAFNELVSSGKYPGLNQSARSGDAADEAMDIFEGRHPELLQVYQKETQFFGPKNIGGGKLDKFTKFVMIPAVRDASSEAERRGAILQLIDLLVMRSVNARPDVRDLNTEFEKRVREVYSSDNLTEIRDLGNLISETLKRYAPGAELDLTFGEVVPPKLSLPPAIASLVEDNFKSPIGYTGHGLQRALIFALLHRLSLTEHASAGVDNNNDGTVADSSRIPDLILGIEEPELYLHPARCRYLSNVILRLARIPETADQPRVQVLYGTHSPYMVDVQRFDQVVLARKVATEGTTTRQTKITSFTRAKAAERLAEISQKDPADYTDASFEAHAAPVMTTIVNEGFFADLVVLVEGNSEVGAIWAVQEKLSQEWDALGITIIPVIGKNNIDRPAVIFQGLGIPTYFIFDGDKSLRGKEQQATKLTNHRLQRLAGVDPQDFPESAAFDTWAVFNDKLETELELALGSDLFTSIREDVAQRLGYCQLSSVLKNTSAAALLVKEAYSKGATIPILEQIVEGITRLRELGQTRTAVETLADVVVE